MGDEEILLNIGLRLEKLSNDFKKAEELAQHFTDEFEKANKELNLGLDDKSLIRSAKKATSEYYNLQKQTIKALEKEQLSSIKNIENEQKRISDLNEKQNIRTSHLISKEEEAFRKNELKDLKNYILEKNRLENETVKTKIDKNKLDIKNIEYQSKLNKITSDYSNLNGTIVAKYKSNLKIINDQIRAVKVLENTEHKINKLKDLALQKEQLKLKFAEQITKQNNKNIIEEQNKINKAYKNSFEGALTEGTTFGHKFATTMQYAFAGTILYQLQDVFRTLVAESAKFDDALYNNMAVLNLTAKEAKHLADNARLIGTEYGGAIEELDKVTLTLGRAGVDTEDLDEAVRVVSQLSTITGDTLSDTSKVVSTFRENFKETGITVEQLGQKLAYMANESKMTTEDLGTFSNYGLSTAKNLNLTIDAVGALATTMSNLGINASTIGTEMQKLDFIFSGSQESIQKFWFVIEKLNPALGSQHDMFKKLIKGGAEGEQTLLDFSKALQSMDIETYQQATSDMEINTKKLLNSLKNYDELKEHMEKIKIIGDLGSQAAMASLGASKIWERAWNGFKTSLDGAVSNMLDFGFDREELEKQYQVIKELTDSVSGLDENSSKYKETLEKLNSEKEKFKEMAEEANRIVEIGTNLMQALAGAAIAVSVAMGAARVATFLFGNSLVDLRGKLVKTGIGALAVGAGYLIASMDDMSDKAKETGDKIDKVNDKTASSQKDRIKQLTEDIKKYESYQKGTVDLLSKGTLPETQIPIYSNQYVKLGEDINKAKKELDELTKSEKKLVESKGSVKYQGDIGVDMFKESSAYAKLQKDKEESEANLKGVDLDAYRKLELEVNYLMKYRSEILKLNVSEQEKLKLLTENEIQLNKIAVEYKKASGKEDDKGIKNQIKAIEYQGKLNQASKDYINVNASASEKYKNNLNVIDEMLDKVKQLPESEEKQNKLQQLILEKERLRVEYAKDLKTETNKAISASNKLEKSADAIADAYRRAVEETKDLTYELIKTENSLKLYETESMRLAEIESKREASLEEINKKLIEYADNNKLTEEYTKQLKILNQIYDLKSKEDSDAYRRLKDYTNALQDSVDSIFEGDFEGAFEGIFDSLVDPVKNAFKEGIGAIAEGDFSKLTDIFSNLSTSNWIAAGLSLISAFSSDTVSQAEIDAAKGQTEFSDESIKNLGAMFEQVQYPMLEATNKMYKHIRNMDENFYQIARAISAQASAGGVDITGGSFIPKASANLYSSKTLTLLSSGLKFDEQMFSEMLDPNTLLVQAYEKVLSQKDYLWKSSSYIATKYTDLPPEVMNSLADVFNEGFFAILEAGTLLGISGLEEQIKNITVDMGTIDFKDLSDQEVADRLNEAISTMFSGVIGEVDAFTLLMDRYAKGAEDAMETLIRIATEYDQASHYFLLIGKDFNEGIYDFTKTWTETYITATGDYTDILGRTVDDAFVEMYSSLDGLTRTWLRPVMEEVTLVFTETTKEIYTAQMQMLDIVESTGGMQSFNDAMGVLMSNFYTDAEQLEFMVKSLDIAFETLGIKTMPTTNDEFRKLLETMDTSTEEGAYLYGQVLLLAESFNSMTTAADNLKTQTDGLIQDIADAWLSDLSYLTLMQKADYASAYLELSRTSNGLISSVDAAKANAEFALKTTSSKEEYIPMFNEYIDELRKEAKKDATNLELLEELKNIRNEVIELREATYNAATYA